MMGAKVGDTVNWCRPVGETQVEIVEISYPKKA
jgi:transcription elongation GreA/GreB family factor